LLNITSTHSFRASLELLLTSELDELPPLEDEMSLEDEFTSLEDELTSLEDEKLLDMGVASTGFSILGKSPSLTQFVRTMINMIKG
jgi:hypothetical protein